MKTAIGLLLLMAILPAAGCSALHDHQGWEHSGDPVTYQDVHPSILEHQH